MPSRVKQQFFSGLKDKFAEELDANNKKRMNVDNVMCAANDALQAQQAETSFLSQKVQEGETVYNQEEFHIGKDSCDRQVEKDMAEGNVNKYMLKILADPKAVAYWEQSRFENLKRSEEAMKLLKKQVTQAKRDTLRNIQNNPDPSLTQDVDL